jgi:hypothetical protein
MRHATASGPDSIWVDGAHYNLADGTWAGSRRGADATTAAESSSRLDGCVSVDGALFDLPAGVWRQGKPSAAAQSGWSSPVTVADGCVSVDGGLVRVDAEPI